MRKVVVDWAPAIAVILTTLGLLGYLIALAIATFLPPEAGELVTRLQTWFMSSPAQYIGIPCAAVAAFAIVAALLTAFPPPTDASGALAFKAFGLEFTGPSGPITLWLLCFLGFVAALRILRIE
jgi:hypothetical protein